MVNISGINSFTSTSKYNDQGVVRSKPIEQKISAAAASSTDKVTISVDAKMANDLEKYALPDWIKDYVAPLNDLTSSTAAVESTRKYQALFDGVKGDRKAAQQFLDNDPATKQFRLNLQKYNDVKSELDQYGKYQKQAMDAAMDAIGATNGKSYYEVTSSDPSAANRAHNVFSEVLASKPDIKSLMGRLDVPAFNSI